MNQQQKRLYQASMEIITTATNTQKTQMYTLTRLKTQNQKKVSILSRFITQNFKSIKTKTQANTFPDEYLQTKVLVTLSGYALSLHLGHYPVTLSYIVTNVATKILSNINMKLIMTMHSQPLHMTILFMKLKNEINSQQSNYCFLQKEGLDQVSSSFLPIAFLMSFHQLNLLPMLCTLM